MLTHKRLSVAALIAAVILSLGASRKMSDRQFAQLCAKGDVQGVVKALNAGANVNAKVGSEGKPPLMFAAEKGRAEVVRILINAGADVNAKDIYGQTPLTEAEAVHRMRWKDNRLQVIEMLKRAGAK